MKRKYDPRKEVGCTAKGPMMNLGFGTYMAKSERRYKAGEKQAYCATCALCVWPEEIKTCDKFKPSPELDAFYEEEAKK
jgi:hypothetical protein